MSGGREEKKRRWERQKRKKERDGPWQEKRQWRRKPRPGGKRRMDGMEDRWTAWSGPNEGGLDPRGGLAPPGSSVFFIPSGVADWGMSVGR